MKDQQTSDLMLIERFQRGDETAMDTLIERHKTRAYHLAYRLTRDPELAADVVADAFVRVYRSGRTFKGQSAFTTWLHRIITNCFLDHRKRASSRPMTSLNAMLATGDSELEWELADDAPSAFETAAAAEQNRAVAGALETLNESHRQMIVMFHSDMLSYEEIAEALRLPLGTVKSRLNRARLALRDVLAPQPAFQSDYVPSQKLTTGLAA